MPGTMLGVGHMEKAKQTQVFRKILFTFIYLKISYFTLIFERFFFFFFLDRLVLRVFSLGSFFFFSTLFSIVFWCSLFPIGSHLSFLLFLYIFLFLPTGLKISFVPLVFISLAIVSDDIFCISSAGVC